jgi:hypothetical protein
VELPTIFRPPHQHCVNSKEGKTFYIFCPLVLAQHPEELPMVVPTKVAQQRRYPPNLPTAAATNNNIQGSAQWSPGYSSSPSIPICNFKPALTKCTILDTAKLRPEPCGEFDGHDQVREMPVTKVRPSFTYYWTSTSTMCSCVAGGTSYFGRHAV